MLTLEIFPPGLLGLPNASPFGMKAEVLMKMSGLPFEIGMGNVQKAPKKKLPLLVDNGQIITDSSLIRFHLEKAHGIDFDNGYSEYALAKAWAIEKMLEDHFYWLIMNDRWLKDDNFKNGPSRFFDELPPILRDIVANIVRGQVKRDLHGQGLSRHTDEERKILIKKCLGSISSILGANTYLLGDKPCGVDATVFAMLSSALCEQLDTQARTVALNYDNLVAYHDRMMAEFYPDFTPNA